MVPGGGLIKLVQLLQTAQGRQRLVIGAVVAVGVLALALLFQRLGVTPETFGRR